MIPVFATYFGELLKEREDPYYQISLTVEGHACQHDVLYKAFGDLRDLYSSSMLYGQAGMTEESKKRQMDASVVGGRRGGRAAAESGQLAEAREKAYAKTRKPIILTKDGIDTIYPSVQEAARLIGGCAGALSLVVRGKRNHHKGYTAKWKN